MKFTLNYLMIKRLGEMAGLEYNDISPMNEIAPDTEALINGLPTEALSETDRVLKELGMADGEGQPAEPIRAFVKALFTPGTCLRAELKEESGSGDVYFIPFDGAWLMMNAKHGELTAAGPVSYEIAKQYLVAAMHSALESGVLSAQYRDRKCKRSVSDNKTTKPDSGDMIVSGDTDITEAAQILTDKLIEYAGKDKNSFEKLFRNTESTVIDQYYTTDYAKFREYGKSLIAIAVQEGDSVWFTALYYQIPANHPAEREQSVYLSTIMTRGNDGWKIEWNDAARSELQSGYDDAGFTYSGREAMEQGYAWAKFFVPFDINNTMIFYDDAVMCKVTEMYMDINNNVQITLYTANGTDKDVGLSGVDIAVADGDSPLFSKHFDMDLYITERNVSIYTLTIPSEELDFTTWSSPKITDFRFSYTDLAY